VASLAFVDHYLSLARDEDREPILTLLATGAGAYYGELVRTHLGATWLGSGTDPRELRLLMTPQLIHFCPTDQAFEAIVGCSLGDDDPRSPPGRALDARFHVCTAAAPVSTGSSTVPDDAVWLEQRLGELAPLPEDEFHSLTGRFETLQLMVELLAARQAQRGDAPRSYGLEDYLAVLDPRRDE
jgi:hypothetical protein